ncbi:hypothetical protein LIER_40097 [Lithospermum erythrorhizon]|uniref:Uncharacterized protein n=1 Tax=Lithospermum erythrorhizon TaxID=34254 RepID=A0AAV3QS12_LITER
MRLLLTHCVDRIIYILLFKDEIGLNLLWGFSPLGQPQVGIVEPYTVTAINDLEIRRTAYSPMHMMQLFARPSGTAMFRTCNYGTMKMPLNIANYLNELNHVIIRNGSRTWKMLVMGNEGVKLVFQWAREYHKII